MPFVGLSYDVLDTVFSPEHRIALGLELPSVDEL
jgi:hypothetical protein